MAKIVSEFSKKNSYKGSLFLTDWSKNILKNVYTKMAMPCYIEVAHPRPLPS